jgi:hypothetical protein
MRLLDKKSLLADGVCEFQWSPKANVLAYWVRFLFPLLSLSLFGSCLCSFGVLPAARACRLV